MFGVSNQHRYFRIQVFVSVAVGLATYLAVQSGVLPSKLHTEALQTFSVHLFTWGALVAAVVITYFVYGELRVFRALILAAIIGFGMLSMPVLASYSGFDNGEGRNIIDVFWLATNIVGFVILGGVAAWFGKFFGLLALASAAAGIFGGTYELVLLSPALAIFNVTNLYAQWLFAIVMAVSSILADK